MPDKYIISSYSVTNVGKRSNNEDSIYPRPDDKRPVRQLYMVCDGVGGEQQGEVASRLACDSFSAFWGAHIAKKINESHITDSVDHVIRTFNDYVATHPGSSGMATTLTMLFVGGNGAVITHVGDSRVYHVRSGKIMFCTRDHSLVNQLLDAGAIRPEEASNHPQRNVITRALKAGGKVTADIRYIPDIREGDRFFLCSDGVLESFSDAELSMLIGNTNDGNEVIKFITEKCSSFSRDNFSAVLVCLGDLAPASANVDEYKEDGESLTGIIRHAPPLPPPPTAIDGMAMLRRNKSGVIAISISLLVIITMTLLFLRRGVDKGDKVTVNVPENKRNGPATSANGAKSERAPAKTGTGEKRQEHKGTATANKTKQEGQHSNVTGQEKKAGAPATQNSEKNTARHPSAENIRKDSIARQVTMLERKLKDGDPDARKILAKIYELPDWKMTSKARAFREGAKKATKPKGKGADTSGNLPAHNNVTGEREKNAKK